MKERTIRLGLQHFLLALCLFVDIVSPARVAGNRTGTSGSGHKGDVSQPESGRGTVRVCVRCIRAHMDFLASDALRGRGSGTPDELVAATYIASEFEQYGIEPAGDSGGYTQRATVIRHPVIAP